MKAKITKSLVDKLQPGDVVSDTKLNGFRVRAGHKDKTYSVQKRVGNKVLTRTIGKHGIYTPDLARKEAQQQLLQLSKGEDPLHIKRKKTLLRSLTFGTLVDLYEAKLENPHTIKDIRSRVRGRLADWLTLPANEITRSMVLAKFKELEKKGPTQARLVMSYARAIYNYGIGHHREDHTGQSLVIQNPINILTEKKELKQTKRRDTYLKQNALRKWYESLIVARKEFPVACDYFLVTLLLGCRRTESAALKWANVDLEHKIVIFRDTKNKTDHHLPMGRYLTDLLQARKKMSKGSEYVFPAESKTGHISEPRPAIKRIAESCGFEFVVSDLRRTFATVADNLDFSTYSIKRLMNHARNGGNDVTQGYIGIDTERQRERMQQLEDHILKMMGVMDFSAAA